MDASRIKEGLLVFSRADRGESHGRLVGGVDHLEGANFIKLQRRYAPDHLHHWIPITWVEKVDDEAIYLNRTSREFHQFQLNDNPLGNERAA